MFEVCTAGGIELASATRAAVAFLLFGRSRECSGRPKDNPTADAPTTVAVAQSCTEPFGQPLQSRKLGAEAQWIETSTTPPTVADQSGLKPIDTRWPRGMHAISNHTIQYKFREKESLPLGPISFSITARATAAGRSQSTKHSIRRGAWS